MLPPHGRFQSWRERGEYCLIFWLQCRKSFGDVHDVVLEDEQIGIALARQAEHVFVVILNPALDGLAIFQLDGNGSLLFPQIFQVIGLSRGVLGWSRLGTARVAPWKTHTDILHGASGRNAYFGSGAVYTKKGSYQGSAFRPAA